MSIETNIAKEISRVTGTDYREQEQPRETNGCYGRKIGGATLDIINIQEARDRKEKKFETITVESNRFKDVYVKEGEKLSLSSVIGKNKETAIFLSYSLPEDGKRAGYVFNYEKSLENDNQLTGEFESIISNLPLESEDVKVSILEPSRITKDEKGEIGIQRTNEPLSNRLDYIVNEHSGKKNTSIELSKYPYHDGEIGEVSLVFSKTGSPKIQTKREMFIPREL
jgi:hypothetical protein